VPTRRVAAPRATPAPTPNPKAAATSRKAEPGSSNARPELGAACTTRTPVRSRDRCVARCAAVVGCTATSTIANATAPMHPAVAQRTTELMG
jgi:hypothetical protein